VTYDSGPNGHLANVAYECEATVTGTYTPAPNMGAAPEPAPVVEYAPAVPAPAPISYAPASVYSAAPAVDYGTPVYEDVVRNEYRKNYLLKCQ